jgi:hypothetical protein
MVQGMQIAKPGDPLDLRVIPVGYPVQVIDSDGKVVAEGLFWGFNRSGQPLLEQVCRLATCEAGQRLIEPLN